ncbi:hypothetical protein TSC_c07940 [Thermus scotoductus SA-01]|uniref:Uncharacterized protein n=1 Tax=Thermus scotoductus (strain ATCC 700910 / SA-01) TaxID=743525 RepID=E8PNE5_THESS|nr:hypothetical protein TSC_c07940 [Thermus scotoductus SA-01]
MEVCHEKGQGHHVHEVVKIQGSATVKEAINLMQGNRPPGPHRGP